ncbi:hypothetical protein GCM10022205_32920 [Spinactinospora alkalitolerans]
MCPRYRVPVRRDAGDQGGGAGDLGEHRLVGILGEEGGGVTEFGRGRLDVNLVARLNKVAHWRIGAGREAFSTHRADGAGLRPGWVSGLYTRLVTEPTYRTAAVVVLALPSARMCNGLG